MNMEAVLLPTFQDILASNGRDLHKVAKSLCRLRLDVKVKQLDIAGTLKWSKECDYTHCEHEALEALSASYTEALHVIDRLVIISDCLNNASSQVEALEVLRDVLGNILGIKEVYLYKRTGETCFRSAQYTGEARPAEILESSRLLQEILRTKRRVIGIGCDPATQASTRHMYLPLITDGEVLGILVCS
jgi:hypothetical protein